MLPGCILTCDFLFLGEGDAGLTDMAGGDADEHRDSLQNLRSLFDNTLVFPGYGYREHAHSTLAEECTNNDRLRRARARSPSTG